MKILLSVMLLVGAFCSSRYAAMAQGSLNPSGPPAPNFKTLSQVEPRFPIADFGTNLTLPGSYYLTTNLLSGSSTGDGITIRTNINNITIDLNGFSIVSTNPAGGSSPVGIRISAATNIVLRNGQVFGFDRGVRAEAPFYGVVVEDVHFLKARRTGIEANASVGGLSPTITIRRCIIEDVDATGEGAGVTADGILLLSCTGVVDGCLVRDIVPSAGAVGTCINAATVTNSFINNNFMSRGGIGLNMTGGGSRVSFRGNLTAGCPTPYVINGGVDCGGNF